MYTKQNDKAISITTSAVHMFRIQEGSSYKLWEWGKNYWNGIHLKI